MLDTVRGPPETARMYVLSSIGQMALVGMVVLFGLAGLLLSALSISGTWLVLLAAVVVAVVPAEGYPGWWTVLCYAVLSALVEGVEALAGAWGVRARGGSRLSGLLAMLGGIAGLVLGSMTPIPVFGPLIGMTVVSFAVVYAVERHRLKRSDRAAGVAFGVLLARVFVTLVKVIVTLGMTAYLVARILF